MAPKFGVKKIYSESDIAKFQLDNWLKKKMGLYSINTWQITGLAISFIFPSMHLTFESNCGSCLDVLHLPMIVNNSGIISSVTVPHCLLSYTPTAFGKMIG